MKVSDDAAADLLKAKECNMMHDFRYADEYVLEDLDVSVADFVQRAMKGNFSAAWDELGPTNELEFTYALSSMKSLEEAVKNIIQYLGLQPCERSDKVPEGKSSHALLLSGIALMN